MVKRRIEALEKELEPPAWKEAAAGFRNKAAPSSGINSTAKLPQPPCTPRLLGKGAALSICLPGLLSVLSSRGIKHSLLGAEIHLFLEQQAISPHLSSLFSSLLPQIKPAISLISHASSLGERTISCPSQGCT